MGTAIGPPETIGRYNSFGIFLKEDFESARRGGKLGSCIKNLHDFLTKAGDKKYLVDIVGQPFVTEGNVYVFGMTFPEDDSGVISSKDLSRMVNHYLSQTLKEPSGFGEKYFQFVSSCRSVARNVMKENSVRISFDSKTLKEPTKIYESFLEFLINKGDDEDFKMRQRQNDLWRLAGQSPAD